MNFKKFISGVSAFAIAASAFAAMTINASAATQSITGSYSGNAFNWIIDGEDAVQTGNGSSAYNQNYSVTVTNPDDDTDSVTLKTHINQYRNSSTDHRDTLLSSGKIYFCQSALKTNNTGSVSARYLVVAPTKNGTFTCDVETVRENGSRNYDEFFYGTEIANDAVSPYTAVADNQLLKLTNSASGSISYHMEGGKTYLISTYSYYGTNQGIYISNLKYADDKVPTSLGITGASAVTIGSSENYSVAVLDQYGDEYETDAEISVSASAATGVSYSNGTLTADNTAVDGSTVTLTASATVDGVNLEATKNVNISSAAGYVINTTPYASISVDGAAAVSTGRTGTYQFAVGSTGEHSVVISKEGYQPVSTTVTTTNNNSTSLALTPNNGIVYQEDFAYVDDNFGGANGIINVNNGVLKNAFVSGEVTSEAVSLPESVNLAGTVTTIYMQANRNDRLGYLTLLNDTTKAIPLFFRGSDAVYWRSGDSGNGTSLRSRDTDWHKFQIYMPTSDDGNHRPVVYIDGIKCNVTLARMANRTMNRLEMRGAGSSGSTTIMSVDYIKVESGFGDTEPTATITVKQYAEDATPISSISYLNGTSFTLPAAVEAEGYTFEGWSDGTNTYAAGTALTADATKTYTAVYEEIVAPSANLTDAAWEVSDTETGYTQSGNTLTDAKGNSVYGYQATLTGNGYAYDTVKVYVKVADGEANAEKTYSNTTFSESGSVTFYVISDTALDKNASRVYCE